jgi:hypothetical protein
MRTRIAAWSVIGLLGLGLAAATDPWGPSDLTQPADLLGTLKAGHGTTLRMVGPRILYNGDHIAGSIYAGPASSPEGIDALLKSVASLPPGTPLTIYCGCCPMDHSPNIRPAYAALKKAGFTNVKGLDIATNLHTDWTAKGYPVEKGSIPKP